jgi:glycosyltransferase involved in cell wall biosynthesis
MRILHVVPTYLPATRYGGPIYSVHGLCKALAALGHEVSVFTTNVDGPGNSAVPLERPVLLDGVQVTYFPSRHLRRLYWSPSMRTALALAIPQVSIVHLHSVFLWPTSAAAQIARRAGIPYVVAPRGMLAGDLIARKSRMVKTLWLHAIERWTLAGAAALHVTTDAEYQSAVDVGLPLPAPCVVPNGVEPPHALGPRCADATLRDAVAEGPYAIVLGRISWKKGLDRLIAAVSGTDLRVLIVGEDDEALRPSLEDQIMRQGLGGQVVFLGPVHGDDKWILLRDARMLVMPSHNENFGNAAVEAMAMGCPVVVTPEVGVATLVQVSGGGLVAEGDPATLRSAMLRLWRDAAIRDSAGQRGRQYAREHLRWESIARSMVDWYRRLGAASF